MTQKTPKNVKYGKMRQNASIYIKIKDSYPLYGDLFFGCVKDDFDFIRLTLIKPLRTMTIFGTRLYELNYVSLCLYLVMNYMNL